MPLTYVPLEGYIVQMEIAKRGYGFDSISGFQFRLNAPNREKPLKGEKNSFIHEPLGRGISTLQWVHVLRMCRNPVEAASAVIDYCTLKYDEIDECIQAQVGGARGNVPVGGLDLSELGKLIDNKMNSRIGSEIEKQMAPILDTLSALVQDIQQQRSMQNVPRGTSVEQEPRPLTSAEAIQQPPPEHKRKPGRPRKNPVVPTVPPIVQNMPKHMLPDEVNEATDAQWQPVGQEVIQ